MGDHFQAVAFPDVRPEDAESVAVRLVRHLVDERVVLPELVRREHCPEGHAPGPAADAFTTAPFGITRELLGNQVAVDVERTVFHPGQNHVELTCARCSSTFAPDDEAWGEAVGAWFEGDDDAAYDCPSCGAETRLVEWDGPWPWAFAEVGLTFWNWPELKPSLLAALGEVAESRVRRVFGKL